MGSAIDKIRLIRRLKEEVAKVESGARLGHRKCQPTSASELARQLNSVQVLVQLIVSLINKNDPE